MRKDAIDQLVRPGLATGRSGNQPRRAGSATYGVAVRGGLGRAICKDNFFLVRWFGSPLWPLWNPVAVDAASATGLCT
jgi:hypothetical protein